MPEQHGGGAGAFRGGVEGRVPGVAGGGLRAALAAHGDRDGVHRVESETAQPVGHVDGAGRRAVLQAVVDGDAAGPDAELGRFEGEGGGEGHRIGSAAAGGQHEWAAAGVVGQDVLEYAADRQAYRRDRGVGTHVRFPSWRGWGGVGTVKMTQGS